ncbi:YhcH/YjgK/YiaL family protein [Sporomusa sp.]|uniref:YhcH/YjgK/YiaL family protein n=1 Tax=Sporomusa sp. TaxID=2078658 RepID=UPI002C2DC555|nr:YhcH/YjgK/YiaL family protein [Sporomusa sp.]HWR42082.1 YhcH/YjgK/YiaL family protein [Sporomusa sp.]
MIIGYLSNMKEEMKLYPVALREGLRFLMETDLASLNMGRHEIQGSKLYAMVSEYETQPKEQRRPEMHEKYIDIQYICSGEEMIGVTPAAAVGEVDENILAERDVIYYRGCADETEIILSKGMFGVYFPWEAHRPNCAVGTKRCKVRKVVVKIAVN